MRKLRGSGGVRTPTKSIGENLFLPLAIPRRACWRWGLRLARTVPIAQGVHLPEMDPEIFCIQCCMRPALRRSRSHVARRWHAAERATHYVCHSLRPARQQAAAGRNRNCAAFVDEEIALLKDLRVVVCLGKIAFDGYVDHLLRSGKISAAKDLYSVTERNMNYLKGNIFWPHTILRCRTRIPGCSPARCFEYFFARADARRPSSTGK